MFSKISLLGSTAAVLSLTGYYFSNKHNDSIFSNEILDDSDFRFMEYVTEFGKMYETKSEYRERK